MSNNSTNISLLQYPTEKDWMEVKRRALVTIGKKPVTPPDFAWKRKILLARHSPIRYLNFSFLLENIPSWVSVHLVRHHVGCQPYVKSQRNDRQTDYDRNTAPQNAPVTMIWDINGEAIMTIANKRLCGQASLETQEVVKQMCDLVVNVCPEYAGLLVPMCIYQGGKCHEIHSCGRYSK